MNDGIRHSARQLKKATCAEGAKEVEKRRERGDEDPGENRCDVKKTPLADTHTNLQHMGAKISPHRGTSPPSTYDAPCPTVHVGVPVGAVPWRGCSCAEVIAAVIAVVTVAVVPCGIPVVPVRVVARCACAWCGVVPVRVAWCGCREVAVVAELVPLATVDCGQFVAVAVDSGPSVPVDAAAGVVPVAAGKFTIGAIR